MVAEKALSLQEMRDLTDFSVHLLGRNRVNGELHLDSTRGRVVTDDRPKREIGRPLLQAITDPLSKVGQNVFVGNRRLAVRDDLELEARPGVRSAEQATKKIERHAGHHLTIRSIG